MTDDSDDIEITDADRAAAMKICNSVFLGIGGVNAEVLRQLAERFIFYAMRPERERTEQIKKAARDMLGIGRNLPLARGCDPYEVEAYNQSIDKLRAALGDE